MNNFKEGDKVRMAQWWLDKYHPNDNKFKGEFEVKYPAYNGAEYLFIKVSDDFVEIFNKDGKYLSSDSNSALLLVK